MTNRCQPTRLSTLHNRWSRPVDSGQVCRSQGLSADNKGDEPDDRIRELRFNIFRAENCVARKCVKKTCASCRRAAESMRQKFLDALAARQAHPHRPGLGRDVDSEIQKGAALALEGYPFSQLRKRHA